MGSKAAEQQGLERARARAAPPVDDVLGDDRTADLVRGDALRRSLVLRVVTEVRAEYVVGRVDVARSATESKL